MTDTEDPLAAYASTAQPTLSDHVRRWLDKGEQLADLVGLVSDGSGPLATLGPQTVVLLRRDVGPILEQWKTAMRSEKGARELDDPGAGRLAVLVNYRGKGGMVFYFYDPTRQVLAGHLDLTARVDNVLAIRLMQAVSEGRSMAVRDLARAAATVAHIAATIWARLHLDCESFVEIAGQSYDQMMAAAESELAQGHNPRQLADVPDLPEGAAGVGVSVELNYDPGVWSRVTDVLTERPLAPSDPNEVATLLMVSARLWVFCRFDRGTFANFVARRVYEQAIEDVAGMPTPDQESLRHPSGGPPS